jgi:hypothetical protein
MSLYLLHIEPRYRHAGHYLGFTSDRTVDRRVNEHLAGGCKASPLIVAALLAGRAVTLARRWEGPQFDRAFERKLKSLGGKSRAQRCPFCGAQRRPANANP